MHLPNPAAIAVIRIVADLPAGGGAVLAHEVADDILKRIIIESAAA